MQAALRTIRIVNRSEPLRQAPVPVLLTLYAILLPIQLRLGEGINFAPSDVVLFAFLFFQPHRIRFRKGAWSVWHAALLPMMTLSALIGAEQIGRLTHYVLFNKLMGALWLLIGYGVISGAISTIAEIRSLSRAFVASVSAINILAIAGFYWAPLESVLPRLNYYAGERLAGFLLDPNAYGGLLLTALCLQAVTWLWKAPLFRGLPGVVTSVSLIVGIALTFSRSAWIGLSTALIFLAAMRPTKSVKMAMVIAGAGLALLISIASQNMDHFYAMASRPSTIESRLNAEGIAFANFLAHPVLGTGLGTFVQEYGLIIHNTYLWFLSECGAVGAVVILGLTMWYFKVAIPAIRSSKGAQQGLIAALAVSHAGMLGVSAGIEVLYQRHWWLVMALIAAYCSRPSRSRNQGVVRSTLRVLGYSSG